MYNFHPKCGKLNAEEDFQTMVFHGFLAKMKHFVKKVNNLYLKNIFTQLQSLRIAPTRWNLRCCCNFKVFIAENLRRRSFFNYSELSMIIKYFWTVFCLKHFWNYKHLRSWQDLKWFRDLQVKLKVCQRWNWCLACQNHDFKVIFTQIFELISFETTSKLMSEHFLNEID